MSIESQIYEHVYANVTDLVNFSLEYSEETSAPIHYEDVHGCTFVCPDCESSSFTYCKAGSLPIDSRYDGEYGIMMYRCPQCTAEYDTQEEARHCCLPKGGEDEEVFQCQDCHAIYDGIEELTPVLAEGIEWWVVSKALYQALDDMGEYTAAVEGTHYWGNLETTRPLKENASLLEALKSL